MSHTKILFLDFDGVLNHTEWLVRAAERIEIGEDSPPESLTSAPMIDPACVLRLDQVCRRTGCYIVVSSTWRLSRTVAELGAILRGLGFTGDVIDRTPDSARASEETIRRILDGEAPEKVLANVTRGHEIQRWMDANGITNTDHIAIVDDDSDMAHLMHRLVQTKYETGLQDEHVERLVTLLGEKR